MLPTDDLSLGEISAMASGPAAPPDALPFESDRELLGDFMLECTEYLDGAEAALLALELDPDDVEALNTVFRAFHTIKGTSSFLGLGHISEFAHHAESLLSRIRDGEIRCEGVVSDLALRSADLMKALIRGVQRTLNGEPTTVPDGYENLVRELCSSVTEEALHRDHSEDEPIVGGRLGDILVAQGTVAREVVESIAERNPGRMLGIALVRAEVASVTEVAQALRKQKRGGAGDAAETSVRVRMDRLDRLAELVGELVVAQSVIAHDTAMRSTEASEQADRIGRVGEIARELQELSMAMCMVPLKPTFQKIARLVRDVSFKSGKQVEFVTQGEETEVDRSTIDMIADPLMHMVRNAVDHGIEPPQQREVSGKPPTGRVRLAAYHASGMVVVELHDDGQGLNRERIVSRAIAKGLIESDTGMSDREVFDLIFAAGLSTAEQVTDLSGRGVGMDVVRRNVEVLGGRVDITSEAGRGSTFTVRLPLTRATTDGMLVRRPSPPVSAEAALRAGG